MTIPWSVIAAFCSKHPNIVKFLLWVGTETGSYFFTKLADFLGDTINEKKTNKNIVEQYLAKREEYDVLIATIEANQGAHDNFAKHVESFAGLQSTLMAINDTFDTTIGSANDYWTLLSQLKKWIGQDENWDKDNYEDVNKAYEMLRGVQDGEFHAYSAASITSCIAP